MREAFRPRKRRRPWVLAVYEAVDAVYAEYVRADLPPPSSVQLRSQMVARDVPGVSDMDSRQWDRMMSQGRWSGNVDWDIPSHHPVLPTLYRGARPVELWVRSYSIAQWMQGLARKLDVTLVHDWKYFAHQSLWRGMNRHDQGLQEGQSRAVLVVSDARKDASRISELLDRQLRHMLLVREARRRFNRHYQRQLWDHQTLYLPPDAEEREDAREVLRRIRRETLDELTTRFTVEPWIAPKSSHAGERLSECEPKWLADQLTHRIDKLEQWTHK